MNLPDKIKQESLQKILNTAQDMLNGEINLIQGSREINRLRLNLNLSNNVEPFNIFTVVDSDTEEVILDQEKRKNFSQQYLEEYDKKGKEYLLDMEEEILSACKKITSSIRHSGISA